MDKKDKDVPKIEVKMVDMTEEMIDYAQELAMKALKKFSIEKDIAKYIKNTFDTEFGQNWHCIVGKQFGSAATHDSKHYLYFYIDEISFLLWKFG